MDDKDKILHGDFSQRRESASSEPTQEAGEAIQAGEGPEIPAGILKPFRRKGRGDGSRSDILAMATGEPGRS